MMVNQEQLLMIGYLVGMALGTCLGWVLVRMFRVSHTGEVVGIALQSLPGGWSLVDAEGRVPLGARNKR